MSRQLSERGGRIRVLLVCSLSLFVVGLDITVVNVALPSIASRRANESARRTAAELNPEALGLAAG